jgi:hypothetical protein
MDLVCCIVVVPGTNPKISFVVPSPSRIED